MLIECIIEAALGVAIGLFTAAGQRLKAQEGREGLGNVLSWAGKLAIAAAVVLNVYLFKNKFNGAGDWALAGVCLLVPMIAIILVSYFKGNKGGDEQ